MDKLGINLGYLIVQILNFAVIFVVLRAWLYKPMLSMLEKRREAVSKGLEDARVASEARANAEQEANKILAEAHKKSEEIIRENSERAESVARQLSANAEAEAAKRREQTLAELDQERTRMLSDLRGQVISLAIAAAQKLIGESLDQQRQHALLEEFFSGLKRGKVVVLENVEELKGATVEVTSALPLTPDEQSAIKTDFVSGGKVVGQPEFSFRVDPSILGGLMVRVGDRVVDGSVAGQLQELRRSL